MIYFDIINIRVYELKGKILLRVKDYKNVRWVFERIFEFDKNYISVKLGLVEIYVSESEYDKVLIVYIDILNLDEENLIVYIGRVNVKILNNNYFVVFEDVYKVFLYNVEFF